MDELTRLELDTLIGGAKALRATPASEMPFGDDAPLALLSGRCKAMQDVLRTTKDPDDPSKMLRCVRVVAVAEAVDARGLLEVNYLAGGDEPMTAFMDGRELVYLVEGW